MSELDVINFTNIHSEDFVGMFGGVEYPIKAGETKPFPKFLAEHFAKHLTDKILLSQEKDFGDPLLREPLIKEILGQVSVPAIEEKQAEPEQTFAEAPIDISKTETTGTTAKAIVKKRGRPKRSK